MAKERAKAPRNRVDWNRLDDEAQVRIEAVSEETGLAKGTIRNMVSKGEFPAPLPKIGPGPNYWRVGDIRRWLRNNRGKRAANE
jgi:predicted DNA-binding transcriptional regulator AlpA